MLKLAASVGGLAVAIYFAKRCFTGSGTCCVYDLIGSVAAFGVALYFFKSYCSGGVCKSDKKLHGKTVVITGGNTGIGKETAIDLAKRGAKVVIACRSMERGNKALKEIREASGSEKVHLKRLDLASLKSIRSFAEEINATEERLDILINNAGIMMCPKWKTEDGFEMQFGTNHLGHFLLTNLMLDLIKKSAPSRIVTVSSLAHFMASRINFEDINSEKSYDKYVAYGQSKLANIMFTRELHRRLKGTGVSCFCLHPGSVSTELQRHSFDAGYMKYVSWPMKVYWKTPIEGAQTNIYCAVQEGLEKESGKYFSDCEVTVPLRAPFREALSEETDKRLWVLSEELVGLKKTN